MQIVLGVIFHFFGGFASGSFYMPYKKVNGWNWESFWIVGGLFSWLIVPPLAAYLTIPNFMGIIAGSSPAVLGSTFLMGLLWGIGGLTYGLGVRYLGVSLGSSIILGLCSFFGALVPAIYYYFNPVEGKDTIADLFSTPWGRWVILGLLVCIAGIIWCGKAGASKEQELGEVEQSGAEKEFQLSKGLILAVVSGVLSAISTIASYDLYQRMAPKATDAQMVKFGRIIAVLAMVLSVCLLPLLNLYESIFNGLNDIIAHIAPQITCVFVLGLFWSKASAKSAQYTLWFGSLIGVLVFSFNKLVPNQPLASIPFMFIAFYLFCFCVFLQISLSFLFPKEDAKSGEQLYWKSILEPFRTKGWAGLGNYKVLSLILFITMCFLYYQFA